MGTPCEKNSVASKLRIWRLRSAFTAGIVRRAFDSAIPAQIVVVAVGVVFEIGLVVPLVVGDQIVEREAVMRRRKIDAGGRLAAVVPE